MFKLFFKCDFTTYREILKVGKRVKGTIQTDAKLHEAYFEIVRNTEYIEKIEELYRGFINNNILWKTINSPYIYKMANVVLVFPRQEKKVCFKNVIGLTRWFY